jgi:hypothetical protein
LEDVQVAEYPVIAAPPSLAGTPKFTMIEASPVVADTAVGAPGVVAVAGTTALEYADQALVPTVVVVITLQV